MAPPPLSTVSTSMGAAASHQPPPQPPPPLGPRPSTLSYDLPLSARRDLRPVEYNPPVQQRSTVRNALTLNRNTVTLVETQLPYVFLIEFEFSAEVKGNVTIYYSATELLTRDQRGRVQRVAFQTNGRTPGRTAFGGGNRQRYRQNIDKGLDVSSYVTNELTYREGAPIPLVIRLQAEYDDHQITDRVLCQITYVEIHLENGIYTPNVILQQVLVNGALYRMQDMYGISGAAETTAPQEIDVTRECVICLTEDSNTAVLPCNHLCLCDECARRLGTETDYHRRKCPVCRTQLRSFLRIISSGNEPEDLPDSEDTVVTDMDQPAPGSVTPALELDNQCIDNQTTDQSQGDTISRPSNT